MYTGNCDVYNMLYTLYVQVQYSLIPSFLYCRDWAGLKSYWEKCGLDSWAMSVCL